MVKKKIPCAFLVLFMCAVLALPVSADLPYAGPGENISESPVGGELEPLLGLYDKKEFVWADFDTSSGGWTSSDGDIPMYITTDPVRGKTASLEIDGYYQNEWRGFSQSFATALDLFCYESLRFSCYIAPDAGEEATYLARALFHSGEKEYEYRTEVTAGVWSEVAFDISELEFRHKITDIEISFLTATPIDTATIRALSIDDIVLSSHMNEEIVNRYSGKNFSSYGAEFYLLEDEKCFGLEVGASAPTLEFDVLSRAKEENNAALFVLDAGKDCTKVSLYFAAEDEDFSFDRVCSLDAKSGEDTYLFAFPSGVTPSRLKLVFEGVKGGSIEIYSISLVSLYQKDFEVYGSVEGVEITPDKKSIRVMGKVGYDTALGYAKSRLELYELEPYEDESAVTGKKCAASLAMTSKFEFYLDITEDFSPSRKYVVCIKDGNGRPVFIDTAKYISNCAILSPLQNGVYTPSSKKGIQSGSSELSGELGAEYTIIDLYLDTLYTEKSTGYLHTQRGDYYYFDIDCVSALDKKIKDSYNAGTAVYLRVLTRDEEGRECALLCNSEKSTAKISAAFDFISSRYNSAASGKIAGIILGRTVDFAAESNYMGDATLGDYVREYVRTLMLIHNTAKANNSLCRVVVPISDSFIMHDYSYAAKTGGAYDKKLFISSLCDALSDCGKVEWSLLLESDEFFLEQREDVICVSNLYLLTDYLAKCKKQYAETPDDVMFLFMQEKISPEGFGAIFAYSYYTCLFERDIGAFILKAEDEELLLSNKELIKYIDTDRGVEYTSQYISYFDVGNWSVLVPQFSESSVGEKTFYSGELKRNESDNYAGEFPLWNFGSAYSTLGWQKGSFCSELLHSKDGDASFIGALFPLSHGSIVYVYDTPKSFELFDALSYDIEIEGVGGSAELVAVIKGNGFAFECGTIIERGVKTTLFFDISSFSDEREIRSIELHVNTDTGPCSVRLYNLCGHSKNFDDAALAAAMEHVEENGERPFNSMWIVIIATLAVASVAALFLIAKHEKE